MGRRKTKSTRADATDHQTHFAVTRLRRLVAMISPGILDRQG
jgi:hypothetical protein